MAGRIGISHIVILLTLWLAATAHAAESGPVKLVVLGDSLAAGYGLDEADAFPNQLQRELIARGHRVEIANGGVSGDTSTGALTRLDWAIPEDTDLVIVELGANDALRGVDPTQTFDALRKIIKTLQGRSIKVLLAGMRAPPNMGADYEAEFNAIYSALARELDVPLYPFFLDGVAANPELNQADGIHPNATGVAEIVDRIRPVVEALVIELGANRSTVTQ